jgi:hypothetical protein
MEIILGWVVGYLPVVNGALRVIGWLLVRGRVLLCDLIDKNPLEYNNPIL